MTDWAERWRQAERRPHQQEPTGPFDQFDAIGRKRPQRLTIAHYLLEVARIDPERVRRVPAAAIEEEGVDEIGEFSYVKCPCGMRPVVRPTLEKCTGCDRNYVHIDLGAVYVAYGNMAPPPLPTVS